MDKKWIKSKKAVLNPKNKDEECFKCAIIKNYITKRLSIVLRELDC